jgi:hypothetical protein
MGQDSTALVRRQEGADFLRAKYEKAQKRDLEIVQGMNRFAELPSLLEDPDMATIDGLLRLPDVELAQKGWTRRELRLALYGRLPKAKWPAAMQAAHERVGMRLRKQGVQPGKMTFNLNMVNIPAPRQPEPTQIVVLDEDEDP